MNAAAHVEVADNGHFSRAACSNEIVENLVDDRFVISAFIAIGPQIKLQRLELDTEFIGNVIDSDGGKIRLTGARAHAGEFGAFHVDFVIALWPRIGENFQLLGWFRRHAAILARAVGNSKSLR